MMFLGGRSRGGDNWCSSGSAAARKAAIWKDSKVRGRVEQKGEGHAWSNLRERDGIVHLDEWAENKRGFRQLHGEGQNQPYKKNFSGRATSLAQVRMGLEVERGKNQPIQRNHARLKNAHGGERPFFA